MAPAELTPKQQWSEQVRTAKSVLILTHANPDGDAVGSSLALKIALTKLGKDVTVATSGSLGEVYKFLPEFEAIDHEPTISKDLLIILDESQAGIGNVSLKRVSDTKLMVVITPKSGFLSAANVRIEEGAFNSDLVIVLDCANTDRLGSIYEQNPNLFFEVPVINIDHHPGNSNFGKVNIVDITASSTAEILVSLLETLGKDTPGLLDADIATCLLAGLITDTNSFQNSNTTPKSLTVAAQLVAAGARQQDIVRHIFKTRSLSTLRLWGRALSYIKEDQPLRFAWSALSKADFVAAQATQDNASGVIDELLKTAAGMEFVLLLTEREGGLHGSFRSVISSVDVSRLAGLFGGGGHTQAAAFSIEGAKLADKEMEIINRLRSELTGSTPRPLQQPAQAPVQASASAQPAAPTQPAPQPPPPRPQQNHSQPPQPHYRPQNPPQSNR